MRSVSVKLAPSELEFLSRRVSDESTTMSAYLRRLLQADRERADSDALAALSLNALAEGQQEQQRNLAECNGLMHSGFQTVSDQLTELIVQQAQNAERLLEANTRLLGAYNATSDLVAAAIEEFHIIADADNTLLETVERRLRDLGKPAC
jgi:ABC-type transporter Mla subunit MlaD